MSNIQYQTKTIRLINRSSVSRNLQISPNSSPFFEFIYNKKSKIAPGLYETVQVKFLPNAYSYFSAQLRVRFEESAGNFRSSMKLSLPKIQTIGNIENQENGKLPNLLENMDLGPRGRVQVGAVVLVPIEAFPKMKISNVGRYLPPIIGNSTHV